MSDRKPTSPVSVAGPSPGGPARVRGDSLHPGAGGQQLIIWGEKTKENDKGVGDLQGLPKPLETSRFLLSSFLSFLFRHFFMVIKHTRHEVCHFSRLQACKSVALSAFTVLCDRAHTGSPSSPQQQRSTP